MEKHGYKDLAHIYDTINQNKDYSRETDFLEKIFRDREVETILDVGCGTGTHMKLLEEKGFECNGIDLNREMLEVAREKVKGELTQGNMKNFDLNNKYDAITCLFAAFNHLKNLKEVEKALKCFKKHLNEEGVLMIDLHNPQRNGKKHEKFGDIELKMKWRYNPETRKEHTKVTFKVKGKKIKDEHTLRIYSIDEMKEILERTGFSVQKIYENFTSNPASSKSKNIEILSRV
ncbi:MAG: class I SAM-dependent DNA methyltransferase [archaeon]